MPDAYMLLPRRRAAASPFSDATRRAAMPGYAAALCAISAAARFFSYITLPL